MKTKNTQLSDGSEPINESDDVDEVLDKGVLNHWTRSQIKAALDQAYQAKFLERLPKRDRQAHISSLGGSNISLNVNQSVKIIEEKGFERGYRQCLSDVKAAIKKEVG